jgi:hypothetical protein
MFLAVLTAGVVSAQEAAPAPAPAPSEQGRTDITPPPVEPTKPLYQDNTADKDAAEAAQPSSADLQSKYDSGIVSTGAQGTGFRHPVIVPSATFTQSLGYYPGGYNGTGGSTWRGQPSPSGALSFMYDFSKTGSISYTGVGRYDAYQDDAYQFHQLEMTQRFQVGRLGITLNDGMSYSPESTFGFGGLEGLPIGLNPGNFVPGLTPDQSIFTQRANRLSNTFGTEMQYALSARTAVRMGGTFGVLRGIDSSLIDSNQFSGTTGLNYRLSASDTVGAYYEYSGIRFQGQPQNIYSHSAGLSYSRRVTGRLQFQASGGAQITDFSEVGGSFRNVGWSGSASANYQRLRNSFSLSFLRSVTGGSGVLFGAKTYGGSLSYGRSLTSHIGFGANAGYSRNVNLRGGRDEFNNHFVGANLSRRFGHYTSAYFSYTLQRQTTHGIAVSNYNALQHLFSIGLSFGYRPIKLSVGE